MLKVPSAYRGLRLVYMFDDNFHDDYNMNSELQVEYYECIYIIYMRSVRLNISNLSIEVLGKPLQKDTVIPISRYTREKSIMSSCIHIRNFLGSDSQDEA